ncbi:hypothetical protein NCCP2716_30240 [Sporosarcina sp. NCCP-2716]|uniref:helix-turn-helix transcriptional regulator n=1 Tax=Sporosarcina sp. NCCP-2716 TaxID=2943679 RepID=UPI00203A67C1|nr:helix-turn-helix transcriptional regulator [Sporosarcina sp. NCCP-2716]GKV70526.1 hypothetical protein NCCP2716_30240 [Sporosarcina sp. NCCP-2716]
MEDRLRQLKKSMNRTLFKHTEFTEAHQEKIHRQLHEEHITEIILSLLTNPKSGMELTHLLHARGIQMILDNEGIVYTVLHDAEQRGWLAAIWRNDRKYYQLTKLGTKVFFQETTQDKQRNRGLLREARPDVQ